MTGRHNPFGWIAHPAFAAGSLVLWAALLFAFQARPQWDLAAASLFFDSEACAQTQRASGQYCAGFTVSSLDALVWIREILHPLPVILAILLAVIMAVELRGGMRWRNPGIRVKALLVAALALGPGLLVNGVLKEYWGRPRPWMTEDFGGWLPFVEAGINTDYCASNCSFVSGEAAAAGWLMCLALLLATRNRMLLAAVVGTAAVVMALLRVAFGAHYLSDAILGFLSTVVIFAVLAAASEWLTRRSA